MGSSEPNSDQLTQTREMKMLTSLIVTMVTASLCEAEPVKYLGAVSPSLFPLRTALDVLQPSPSYTFPYHLAGYPASYYAGYYPGLLPQAFHPQLLSFANPFAAIPTEGIIKPPHASVEEVVDVAQDGVDVAEEVLESGVAPGEVVIRKPVTSLPALPTFSLDRKTQAPVIPAGIAQATQPQFVQKLFQNAKVAPGFQFVVNSKISPFLQELSSGVQQL